MDLLQGVKDAIPGGDENELISEETKQNLDRLLSIMKNLNLSSDNEQQLHETLLKKAKMGMLGGFMPDAMKQVDNPNVISDESIASYKMIFLLFLISFVFFIFVFFGYKLYKSHTDRERRREEKRRLKQQKKKK